MEIGQPLHQDKPEKLPLQSHQGSENRRIRARTLDRGTSKSMP